MNRTKLALDVVEHLKQVADSLERLVEAMKSDIESSAPPKPVDEKPITIEQVRAVLAEKSQAGKQAEVKALLSKYGVPKLTALDPSKYKDMLAEAEVL